MPRPEKDFYRGIERYWRSRCDLRGPAWHDMKQRFLCCLSNIRTKKINATWQHYIKSFCALIFLFCLCTFVWGAQSRSRGPGGAELARTMWESEEETAHVVFSLQFLLWLHDRLHLYRPFHTSTSSISANALQTTFLLGSSPQLDPEILLKWRHQNQQRFWCETRQNTRLMSRIKIKWERFRPDSCTQLQPQP